MRFFEITEDFLDAFKMQRGNKPVYVELFIDPSSKELRQMNAEEGIRAFLTKNHVIVWKNYDALHQNVREKSNIPQDAISLVLYTDPNDPNIEVVVTDNTKGTKWYMNPDIEDYIKQHPAWWVDEDYVQVHYHNEAEVGRWEELND